MYLKRLEMQGFKTFAVKTVLEFSPEGAKRRGVTSIVGPNGSGKSNVADAIRWVMGEQSMKLLRGKKQEDLIFSGSQNKARSGFAEVSMTLVTEQSESEDLPAEIVLTRRLYRDGKSEFEINRQQAKLADVTMLLAQSGIGQRTYSVIGQGMADAILSASPAERKEFFDEAAGLRPFQLKRHQSVSKLDSSRERLAQADALLREITPRLSSLERQVKRLEQRDALEADRVRLEKSYYGGSWHELSERMGEVKIRLDAAQERETKFLAEAKAMQEELAGMEQSVPPSVELDQLRRKIEEIAEERSVLRERQAKLYAQVEIAKAKAQAQRETRTPLSFSKIIEAVEVSQKQLDTLLDHVRHPSPDVAKIKPIVESLHAHHADFSNRLQRPVMEEAPTPTTDPEVEAALKQIVLEMDTLTARTKEIQAKMAEVNRQEDGKRAHLFETQRQLNARRDEARQAERAASDAAVEMARWETRRDAFLSELRTHRPDLESTLDVLAQETGKVDQVDTLLPQLSRTRSQLEWIGNIDPATQKEYKETKERFEFLTTQVEDLRGAIRGLDTVIAELDETIRTKSEQAFHILNSEFSKTFRSLFGGGEAALLQVAPEPTVDEEGNLVPVPADAPVAGIDIQATPPGKRLKSIALLSGGERALTSIALISAIMATNPSPFIVLDEVDAALDEVNTKKYADILEERANATQFIVVTHNRTTMHQASTIYGVTLGEDGSSKVLSVRLEDVGTLQGKG